jgi:rSAM/selenodomain-associated transferase 1
MVALCGIAVMAKASVAGRTKTRLVPPLDYQEAAAFNTAFLRDIAENLLAAARRVSITGYMAYGPPGSDTFFQDGFHPDIGRFEAWLPAFGDCLHLAVQEVLKRGHASAVVLNSDSPTLPTSLLVEAAEFLAQPGDRAVLGPANDGGYYLLGLKHAHRRMFEAIEWSTERVAAQTLERARELRLTLHVLAPWYDVDDRASLRILHGELDTGHAFNEALESHGASHTAKLMRSLLRTTDLAARIGAMQALEGVAS